MVARHPGATRISEGVYSVPAAGAAEKLVFSFADDGPLSAAEERACQRLLQRRRAAAAAAAAPGDAIEMPARTDAERDEADAAFEALLAQHPGAAEIMPGVYSTAAAAPNGGG